MLIKQGEKILTVREAPKEEDSFEALFEPFFKRRWMKYYDNFIIATKEADCGE